jgi:quercetin dioxygenase-like cupin family protein
LSEAFISRLERGAASASVANLVQMAEVLGLTMQELFETPTAPRRTRLALHRTDDAADFLNASGYRWQRVAGGAPKDNLDVFRLVFPPKSRMRLAVSHPGQEHCYILAGRIAFHVHGERFELAAGDSIYFAAEQAHRVDNLLDIEAHMLMTVARQELSPTSMAWWKSVPGSREIQTNKKVQPRSTEEADP